MLIPKHHRKFLRAIGFPHWFWYPIPQWSYGDRYKFKDRSVVYLFDGEVVTIRKNARVLWRKDYAQDSV